MRKGIVFITLISIVFGLVFPSSGLSADVNYSEEVNDARKLNIISLTENYGEYTYEENGETFKVIENVKEIGKDGSKKVTSIIYKKDDQGKFKKESNQTTIFHAKEDKLELKTTKTNGKITHEVRELNTPVKKELVNENLQGLVQPLGVVPTDPNISPWYFVGTYKYSNTVKNLTIHGIILVVGGVVAKYLPENGKFWTGVLTGMAELIFEVNLDYLWYTQHEYKRIWTNTITNLPAARKVRNYIYIDKYRTTLLPGESFPIIEEVWYEYPGY